MSIRVGDWLISVPDDMEHDLDAELTAGDWHEQWAELAESDPIELRGWIGDVLGIDLRHVHLRRIIECQRCGKVLPRYWGGDVCSDCAELNNIEAQMEWDQR
jgi:hypothetical protein